MTKIMRMLSVLCAVLLVSLVVPGDIFAKDANKMVTVMVIQGGQVITTQVRVGKELSAYMHGTEVVFEGADKMNVEGALANLRTNLASGNGAPVTKQQLDALSFDVGTGRRYQFQASKPIMPKPGGGGGSCSDVCTMAYRSGTGDVICTGGCYDCYVLVCTS